MVFSIQLLLLVPRENWKSVRPQCRKEGRREGGKKGRKAARNWFMCQNNE